MPLRALGGVVWELRSALCEEGGQELAWGSLE